MFGLCPALSQETSKDVLTALPRTENTQETRVPKMNVVKVHDRNSIAQTLRKWLQIWLKQCRGLILVQRQRDFSTVLFLADMTIADCKLTCTIGKWFSPETLLLFDENQTCRIDRRRCTGVATRRECESECQCEDGRLHDASVWWEKEEGVFVTRSYQEYRNQKIGSLLTFVRVRRREKNWKRMMEK